LVRRAGAAAIGLLLLILFVVFINACQDSRRKNALRTWNQDAAQIVSQSDTEVGAAFFEAMRQAASQNSEDLQTQISGLRATADTHLAQARKLDTPGELVPAQDSLLIALEFRRDALQYVSERILTAQGSEGDAADQAIEGIAGEMQAYLASDVLVRMRVTPLVAEALKKDDVVAEAVATDGTLPSFDWLDASFVADQLGTSITGTRARERNQQVAPGLHGNGLTGTTINGVELQPDPAANKVPLADPTTVEVSFADQGENDELDVVVKVTLQGGTGKDITGRKIVGAIAQGATATAEVELSRAPTAGEVYTVNVEVVPVPGEEKTDNNSATYNVLFE
jgi:hypothetical protein